VPTCPYYEELLSQLTLQANRVTPAPAPRSRLQGEDGGGLLLAHRSTIMGRVNAGCLVLMPQIQLSSNLFEMPPYQQHGPSIGWAVIGYRQTR